MEWWLNVFFLVNGVWISGQSVDGWAPRAYETEAICLERKVYAERQCRDAPLPYEARWVCSQGEPLTTLPAPLSGVEC